MSSFSYIEWTVFAATHITIKPSYHRCYYCQNKGVARIVVAVDSPQDDAHMVDVIVLCFNHLHKFNEINTKYKVSPEEHNVPYHLYKRYRNRTRSIIWRLNESLPV